MSCHCHVSEAAVASPNAKLHRKRANSGGDHRWDTSISFLSILSFDQLESLSLRERMGIQRTAS